MKTIKLLRDWWKSLRKEIRENKIIYIILSLVLAGASFIRFCRLGSLLNFYYDQGRDALVIWRLWHEGKLFLIGPITGLKGIFLGPFYYYLIAPFYLLGGGNPLYPAVFLAFLSVIAILMVYILGNSMHSRMAGLFAAIIAAFSFNIFLASRWLANPTPILLSSVLLLYSLWEIVNGGSRKWWIVALLLVGLSLQFESASAVFYIPILLLFLLWMRYGNLRARSIQLPDLKTYIYSLIAFFITIIPQIIFNFRHENILFKNVYDLFFQEKAFQPTIQNVFVERSNYFWRVLSTKLFPASSSYAVVFIFLSFLFLLIRRKNLRKGLLKLFLIFLGTPIIGYYLFQGNYGNIYDYYLTGYYLPFIVIFSIGLVEITTRKVGYIVIALFFLSFLNINLERIGNYLINGPGENVIVMEDELRAVDWVFDDARGKSFNVDVYVPPVIPYSYDYLFLWQGNKRCGTDLCGKVENNQSLLYILYEKDIEHPQRLTNWLSKYENNTVIEDQEDYGNIVVQRRIRTN